MSEPTVPAPNAESTPFPRLATQADVAAMLGDLLRELTRTITTVSEAEGARVTGLQAWHQMMELHLQMIGQAQARIENALGEQGAQIHELAELVVKQATELRDLCALVEQQRTLLDQLRPRRKSTVAA